MSTPSHSRQALAERQSLLNSNKSASPLKAARRKPPPPGYIFGVTGSPSKQSQRWASEITDSPSTQQTHPESRSLSIYSTKELPKLPPPLPLEADALLHGLPGRINPRHSDSSTGESLQVPLVPPRTRAPRTPQKSSEDSSSSLKELAGSSGSRSPFHVIYEGTNNNGRDGSAPKIDAKDAFKSPSYIQIESTLLAGRQIERPPHVPTVTIIDSSLVRRTGSVMSREASLRHRNTIRRRNKMMRKEGFTALGDDSALTALERSKRKPRRSFPWIFPIKRRTSFKYYPVTHERPFNSQKDIDNYFLMNNIAAVMKDVLPRTMMKYDYKGLTHCNPQLVVTPAEWSILRNGVIQELVAPRATTKKVEPPPTNTRDLYIAYRQRALAGKTRLPPRIQDVLPDAAHLTSSVMNLLNTQFLLEVLLRRTLAAKIDFRLRKSGVVLAGTVICDPPSPLSHSTGSRSRSSTNMFHQRKHSLNLPRHQRRRRLRKSNHAKSNSVRSDMPSPQISFRSHVFAHDILPETSHESSMDNRSVGQSSGHSYRELARPKQLPSGIERKTGCDTLSGENQWSYQGDPDTLVVSQISGDPPHLMPKSRSEDTFSSIATQEVLRLADSDSLSDHRMSHSTQATTVFKLLDLQKRPSKPNRPSELDVACAALYNRNPILNQIESVPELPVTISMQT